jgi:uncharacterized DUF497 family protein
VTRIRFEWDDAKNLANQRNHGVSFQQASRVFHDPLYLSIAERIENGEVRWQTTGLVAGRILLIVAHTVREQIADEDSVEVIRIISARNVTRKERRRYEEENG